MKRAAAVMLGIVIWSASRLCGQSSGRNLHFDLSRMGFALDGRQIGEATGRLQDYSSKVMDQIIAAGPAPAGMTCWDLNDKRPAWEQFNDFIKKHGRKAVQTKWQTRWNKHSTQIYGDTKERCFRLKEG